MSLDAAHVDLSGAFEYGQGYVALSRVRTLGGLTLAGFNERALAVHPAIAERDVEFRRQSDALRAELATGAESFARQRAEFIKRCGGRKPRKERAPRGSATIATEGSAAKPDPTAERPASTPSPKAYSVDEVRERHPNAYRAWSTAEDLDLARRFAAGEDTAAIAQTLGRQPGAIRSRLAKLGLVDE